MSIGTMLFNPFTGTARHPSDIASDPRGILIWDGEEPLRAAPCLAAPEAAEPVAPLQSRVDPWLIACFGETIARDAQERNHRFLEEALELAQACDCTASEAHQLVDYVFGRPVGERSQEVGGALVTLAALCLAHGIDMHAAGETELARIWTKVETIRAKQAAKPKHSPLPAAPPTTSQAGRDALVPFTAAQVRRLYDNSRELHGRRKTMALAAFERVVRLIEDAHSIESPTAAGRAE